MTTLPISTDYRVAIPKAARQWLFWPFLVLLAVAYLPTAAPAATDDREQSGAVSFTNDVMAVLGKAGCNAGACHGHNSGKGGFKLSLRGSSPASDHQAIVRGLMGRRIDPLDPDASLLLLKPSGQVQHGGGKRFGPQSEFYGLVRRWIAGGAISDVGRATKLERIEVVPDARQLTPMETQQLSVRAYFSDGSVHDVTDRAAYELSSEGSLEVSLDGQVTARREGEAAVLVRYLGQMGLSQFLVIRPKPDFVWTAPPAQNFIDRRVYDKLRAIQVLPSELSSDSEFLRRVSFDTTGLPPTPDEVRAFLADTTSDKRLRKIDELLKREEFGDLWAAYWLELSGTHEGGDSARFKGMWTLSLWLSDVINRNLPYDQFVRAVVAGKGSSLENPAITFGLNRLAKAEIVPQLFLGVRLECAQCHDHPFDVWKQADYRALGEFFNALASKEGPHDSYGAEGRRFVAPEKFLPWERDKTVQLRLLDGSTLDVAASQDRREALVDWMFGAAAEKTARALVNRTWGKLFGRGIVEPVDDMRFSNPPVNEPLLAALAKEFVDHQYDFKHLVRTILNSRTYQLSSVPNATNTGELTNFSHAMVRRLSAEQLLDAIVQATGAEEAFRVGSPGLRAVQIPYENTGSRFLAMFGRPTERKNACVCIRSQETTLPQVLHLLNGDTAASKLRAEGSTLNRLLETTPSMDRLIEGMYLTVLSRLPTDDERTTCKLYASTSENRDDAAEDIMWSLISSQEFLFNH